MSHVLNLIRNFFAAVLAVIMGLIPFSGGRDAKSEEPLTLRVAMVSDVHIDQRLPLGQLCLISAYKDMVAFEPDAFMVLGDLTNYGDTASMDRFFEITDKYVPDSIYPLVISGNHDIGHSDLPNPEALQYFTELSNRYFGYAEENPYFAKEVNGYTFIFMNDESEDNWDHPEYSDAQLQFLDEALAEGTKNGKPVFVMAHVPLADIHGEAYFYEGGGTEEPWNKQIRTTLEKYKNVFFLTGHFHKGLSNNVKYPTYTEKNGVHYLNMTSLLMPNWPAEYAVNGLGFIMEVTEHDVTFRTRNYYTRSWYANFDYTTPIE